MLFHSFLVGGLGPDFEWLSRFGWAGVDIFFVLSGFLIGVQVLRPLQRGQALSFSGFYARRAWRILPAFAVVLAIYVFIPSAREAPGLEPWWKFATFTMNLLVDYGRNQAFSHAWSLCVEEHFYLIFPLVAVALSRRPCAAKFFSVAVGLVLLGLVLRGSVWLFDSAADPQRNWFIEDIYYPSWMRMDGLLVGVLLASFKVYRPQAWDRLQTRANAILLAGIAVCCLALVIFRDRTGLLANTLGWPLLSSGFGLLVFAGADKFSLISGRVRGAGWIASISYSLYLSHKLAYHFAQEHVLPLLPPSGYLQFLAYASAALVFGALVHFAVERPFLRLRDSRASTLEAPTTAVGAREAKSGASAEVAS